ncbi:MAG: hypothetical protein Q6L50_01925 [Gloeomargarita sp. GMQP_bins_120]
MKRRGLALGLVLGGLAAAARGQARPTLLGSQSGRGLRVSNRTKQPLRLVLLARKPGGGYQEPVHWDFAPGEGERDGLLLSLPEGPLVLQVGDILVAFSLDGSRRYWGPFVVGSTGKPTRPSEASDWLLIL